MDYKKMYETLRDQVMFEFSLNQAQIADDEEKGITSPTGNGYKEGFNRGCEFAYGSLKNLVDRLEDNEYGY